VHRVGGRLEEAGLLRDGLDEEGPVRRQGGGEGQPGIAAATAEIDEPVEATRPQDPQRHEAVGDVPDGDPGRIADRGQVDRLVPGEQQPDVIADRPTRRPRKVDGQRPERSRQRRMELGGKGRKGIDARRERVRRTVQAPLLSVVPVRAVRGPLPASSYVTPRSIPVFRCRSGSRPGFPVPLAGLGPQAVGADAGR
jgi:hypothetical protein